MMKSVKVGFKCTPAGEKLLVSPHILQIFYRVNTLWYHPLSGPLYVGKDRWMDGLQIVDDK